MTIDDAIKHAEEVANKTFIDLYQTKLLLKKYDEYEKTIESCMRCANDHLQLARWLKELKHARVLLKAAYEIFKKCDDSSYVLNVLEQLVTYDVVECDGYCLMEDIKEVMEEWNDN